jgi:hypothetical protein
MRDCMRVWRYRWRSCSDIWNVHKSTCVLENGIVCVKSVVVVFVLVAMVLVCVCTRTFV